MWTHIGWRFLVALSRALHTFSCVSRWGPAGGLKVKRLVFMAVFAPRPALLSLTTIYIYAIIIIMEDLMCFAISNTAYSKCTVLFSDYCKISRHFNSQLHGLFFEASTTSEALANFLHRLHGWGPPCVALLDCWVLDYSRCDTSATIKTHQQINNLYSNIACKAWNKIKCSNYWIYW